MALVLRNAWRVQSASRAAARPLFVYSGTRLGAFRSSPRLHTRREDGDVADMTTSSPSPLIYPESPSAGKHHDLVSFLHHADHTGLDPASTTYVGTHYEYTVADHLARLGFGLQRIGGASDRGIDLLGTWTIPANVEEQKDEVRSPIRVLLQCKAGTRQRVGPHLVRELEGAFVGAPPGWRTRSGDNTAESSSPAAVVGLLVTEKPATKGIRDALARSRWPMAYVCCSSTGQIKQMLWNQRAEQEAGLAGLGVTIRHTAEAEDQYGIGGDAGAHIVLTWHGRVLPSAAAPSSSSTSGPGEAAATT